MAFYQQHTAYQPFTPPVSAPNSSPTHFSNSHQSISSNSSSCQTPTFSYHAFRHLVSVAERSRSPPVSHAHPPTTSNQHLQSTSSTHATVTKATILSLLAGRGLPDICALPITQIQPITVGKDTVDFNAGVPSNLQSDKDSLRPEAQDTVEICTATQHGRIPPGYPLFRCKYHCTGTCCSNYVRSGKAACGDCMVIQPPGLQ